MNAGGRLRPLTAIVTSDLGAIVRGRSVPLDQLDRYGATGIGWLPANIALTPFNGIADNPFGSRGDLRVVPDNNARFLAAATGSETPFDMVVGDVVSLDGQPWENCPRSILRSAADALQAEAGFTVLASFEQEFQILDADLPADHALSLSALRRTDPFGPRLMQALEEAGVDPEVLIAEFGLDQFEVTCAPSSPVTAADRCIAIREITREVARNLGWRASFAPKVTPDGVGNGVHIHFSLRDAEGRPATYDPDRPGGLSLAAGAFCAGVVRHLRALTALTAPSVASYQRLKPHSWSAAYTWLGDRDREASLRICPVPTFGGADPAAQFNIEYRAADATGNPYLGLAAILRAGLAGITDGLAPVLFAGDPESLNDRDRAQKGLHRLPDSLGAALDMLVADNLVVGLMTPDMLSCFLAVKQAEIDRFAGQDPAAICAAYAQLY